MTIAGVLAVCPMQSLTLSSDRSDCSIEHGQLHSCNVVDLRANSIRRLASVLNHKIAARRQTETSEREKSVDCRSKSRGAMTPCSACCSTRVPRVLASAVFLLSPTLRSLFVTDLKSPAAQCASVNEKKLSLIDTPTRRFVYSRATAVDDDEHAAAAAAQEQAHTSSRRRRKRNGERVGARMASHGVVRRGGESKRLAAAAVCPYDEDFLENVVEVDFDSVTLSLEQIMTSLRCRESLLDRSQHPMNEAKQRREGERE